MLDRRPIVRTLDDLGRGMDVALRIQNVNAILLHLARIHCQWKRALSVGEPTPIAGKSEAQDLRRRSFTSLISSSAR